MKDKPNHIQRSLWEAGSRSRISVLQKLLTYRLNDVYSLQYASIGGMSVAYRSKCRPTIGQPLSVNVDRHIGRVSVDISTDARPICRSTYRSRLGQYVDRDNMSTDISVKGCTKYTWSHFPYIRVPTDAQVYILYVHKMKKMQRKLGLAGPTQTILQNEEKKKVKL